MDKINQLKENVDETYLQQILGNRKFIVQYLLTKSNFDKRTLTLIPLFLKRTEQKF